ncbi:MAG: hypothetical protein IPJ87_13730 [Flavobacteriales bacterium]|nr:hypothetical protein [Flavobacteriales bacterium]MBK7942911.1 hypothetical protein [Flavobacteriales bacterium]MBK9698689.1 hypothetical protein [Flavobacteriales bacterium]
MKALLDTNRMDTVQLALNAELGNYLSNSRLHEPYLQRASALAAKLHDHPSEKVRRKAMRTEARIWNIRGVIHWEDQRYGEAVHCYERFRELAVLMKDTAYRILAANNIGLLLNSMDLPDKAMPVYKGALLLSQRSNHPYMTPILLGRVGLCYMQIGDTVRAESHLVAAIGTATEGFASVPARVALASLRIRQRRPTDAVPLVDSIRSFARNNELDGPNWLGDAYYLRARIDTTLEDFERALLQLDTCIKRTTEMNIAHGCVACLLMRAQLLDRLGDLKREEADLLQILELAQGRTLLLERSMAAQRLKSLYARQGRIRDELRMTEQLKDLGDTLHAIDAEKALMAMDFNAAIREDSLSFLAQQGAAAKKHANELGKEQNRRTWLMAALLFAAGAATAIWNRTKILRRANQAILEAQSRLLASERAREASEVRTRIARDVHDQLGSDLTKLVMLSTEAKVVAQGEPSGLSSIANDIERIAGEANRSLGDIVWSIDPHHDSLAGLTERVRAHCERMLKWSKVDHTIDCVHEGPDRSLDPATKRDIYLMLREALNNAIKYAKAGHIHVRFHTSAAQVEFEVKDDGVGMLTAGTKGHGLPNMRSRAQRVNGEIQVESSPGAGTRVRFQTPLPG